MINLKNKSVAVFGHLSRRYILIASALMLVAAAGVAAGGNAVGWWDGKPVPGEGVLREQFSKPELLNKVDLARARVVAAIPNVDLVAVPQLDGGYCITPMVAGDTDMPITCDEGVDANQRDVVMSWSIAKGHTSRWVVAGRITDAGATSVSLFDLQVELAPDGFFLASIPPERWKQLHRSSGTLTVAGSQGETIREACFTLGHSPQEIPRDGQVSISTSTLTSRVC